MLHKLITLNNTDLAVYSNGKVINVVTGKEVKFSFSGKYLRARIGNKNVYLHRLLAMCFLEDFDPNLTVNHEDGNKLNNDISNLEMLSRADNTRHAHRTGITNNKGVNNKSSKLSEQEAIEIYNCLAAYKIIAEKYNISLSTISLIKAKKKWKSIHS